MTWTNFASLGVGPGTTPQLDANFLAVSQLLNIPCTVSGTNTLTLTSTAGTSTLAGYANYMNLDCVAAASNSGGVTANFNGFGPLNVYKDTPQGPQLLTGGEIVQNCQFVLIYDSTLNSSAGGFHLFGGGNVLAGQAISVASITAATASLSIVNEGNVNAASLSLGSMQIGASILNAVVRMYSTLASISFGVIVPGASAQATVSFAGCQVLDNVIVGLPAAPNASVSYLGFVPAAGSVVVRASNNAPAATVSLSLVTFRVTDIGWAT